MYEDEDLEDIDISPEEDLIVIIHKGGDFSVIPPENEDVSYVQVELLEQVLVSLRPSIFLLVFLKIEIGLIRVWEYLFKKEGS
jgi:hypothetical protein